MLEIDNSILSALEEKHHIVLEKFLDKMAEPPVKITSQYVELLKDSYVALKLRRHKARRYNGGYYDLWGDKLKSHMNMMENLDFEIAEARRAYYKAKGELNSSIAEEVDLQKAAKVLLSSD